MADAATLATAEAALKRELDQIEDYEIAPPFLFLCDFAATLAKNDIPVQAIGIAGGSMLLFASGLCHVYPPEEGLFFEHFFDGSKFHSVGRKIFLSLDVPARVDSRLVAAWTHRARSVKANGLGLAVELTPRRYLSRYRRLRRKKNLLSPTRIRSAWNQLDSDSIVRSVRRFFSQDYPATAWFRKLSPLTWNQLMLLVGRCEQRPEDGQFLEDFAARCEPLGNFDMQAREAQCQRIVQDSLHFREDIMTHARQAVGASPSLVSQLMLAVCKQQPERVRQLQEAISGEPGVANHPRVELEAALALVVDRSPRATSKAHACCRALWAAYLAYAGEFSRETFPN